MSDNITIKEFHFFSGHPGKFWPSFLQFACRQADADCCILLKKTPSQWRQIYQWSADKKRLSLSESRLAEFSALADACLSEGVCTADIPTSSDGTAIVLLFDQTENDASRVAVFFSHAGSADSIKEIYRRLSLIADAPAVYQRERTARQVHADRIFFADVLDTLLLMNAENRFLGAAMVLVNETASRYRCARVSLGWRKNAYIDLQAISHMERFEKKMDIVSSLEAAMEEAIDQDEEILWPAEDSSGAVTRDHEAYAKNQQAGHLVSLPLRLNDEPVGVLTCERENPAFSEEDVHGLRILCDQVSCRLAELKQRDRWFGARIRDAFRNKLSHLLGAENTLLKMAVLITGVVLLLAVIVKIPYRIEAPFILRSDDVRQVSAPFDSYIDDVAVKIGQRVDAGDPLLLLDTRDLMLEESAAVANQIRFLREGEKARALNSLIEMKIAQARADQAKAQLEMIRHRLTQAQVRSPITGMVVEGDLEELQGAPVSKGDILFKVARHENLFIELKISEADIHEIAEGLSGEIAFVSQPHLKYPFKILHVDPVAVSGDAGNFFIARGKNLKPPASWWRPGMSGIAKINAGSRRAVWIVTHRTVDFFQMLMWW